MPDEYFCKVLVDFFRIIEIKLPDQAPKLTDIG